VEKQQDLHIIKKVIVINVILPFFVFIYNQCFLFVYNPYITQTLATRISSSTIFNMFIIIFLAADIPLALFIGYRFMPVKKAMSDASLVPKAIKRILQLPYLVIFTYLAGFLTGTLIAYLLDALGVKSQVPLNDLVYVFCISLFSSMFVSSFVIIIIDNMLYKIKQYYGLIQLEQNQRKFPIQAKILLSVFSGGFLILSISQYIGYFYIKKGANVDTGDFFFNVFFNSLFIVILAGLEIILICRNMSKMLKYIRDSLGDIIKGKADLSKRINIIGYDEIGLLTSDFNKLLIFLNNMIIKIGEISMKIDGSKAILFNSIEGNKAVCESFIKSIDKILAGIKNDFDETKKLEDIAIKISDSANTIDNSVQIQEKSVQSSSASIEELIQSINNVTKISTETNRNISDLITDINEGKKSISSSVNMINYINTSSSELLDFVKSISDISERIKLLAINASIEAARAGKSGEGFAVVANEVRKLSESSSVSSQKIESKISDMTRKIFEGTELINSTGANLEKIFGKVESTIQIVDQIANSMLEQEIGTKNIEKGLSDMMNDSLHLVEQINKGKELSRDMKSISDNFVGNSREIFSMAEDQKAKNSKLIDINKDLVNAFDSMKAGITDLEKILSEFKLAIISK
jgi:methyl-accepting chemotaxis protein